MIKINGLNQLSIIGYVTKDAELKDVFVEGKPTARCKFSVAVNETRANGQPTVTYFEVTAWREYAVKIAKWIKKSRKVYVTGAVRLNQYVDAVRVPRAVMQIHSPTVILLDSKPEEEIDEFDGTTC